MIDARGRPRRAWRISTVPYDGGLLLRLDDDDDPEYWEEIRIPETELLRQLAHVHRLSHGAGLLTVYDPVSDKPR